MLRHVSPSRRPSSHYDVRLTTYVAAVVDESGKVAALGGVDDGVVVDAEHVAAADALLLVAFLPHVRDHLKEIHGRFVS